ncbi:tetratricopeptide repeat protein [Microvirga sp. STS02]|uniref:ATP-binding protein n=1 Tax=Hymenobacter negativus TaxID=2795026 RepID=UPI0018DDB79E|nr:MULTISPECIES: ATP-binding protein [Bacteria]MBH8570275.1 tetratricopeptide repeat protein [Hymenobacter negativus]MBR7210014.1 tetratricopeptide repeat protein [Microvirga sp. STS02]
MRPGLLIAQPRTADSLQAVLRASPRPDTTRVRRLQALSQALFMDDAPRSTAVLEQALALSRQLRDSMGMGQELLGLGTRYRRRADYGRARQRTQEAQALFATRRDMVGLANTFLQWSLIENEQANPAAALRAALRGLTYAEKSRNLKIVNRTRVAIGGVYVQLGNYQDALDVLLPIFRNAAALRDEHMVASALNMVGNCYRQLNDQPKALRYLRRSVQLNRKTGDVLNALSDEIRLSELYAGQGKLPQALYYATQARAEAKATKDSYNLPPAELAVARVYLLQGRTDSAVALAEHAFTLSQPSRSNENLRNGSDILAQAYARRGDFANAYRYQRLWGAYKDSVAGIETQRRTSALRYGYELERKQDQIALLTQRQQLQEQKAHQQRQEMRGLLAGLAGLLLLAGLLARNIFLKQRTNRALNEKNEQIAHQRDRLDQALTKLKVAQSQLVQSEKMVALAALTAGVAHEIQNPLNFVNNFSEVSLEMLTELEEARQEPTRDPELEASLLDDLKQNLLRINQHGGRAAGIVRGMLEHAHADPGQRQPVDLNDLAQDYLRLAYHSLQNTHRDFTVARTLDLDPALGSLHVVPQELGRVLLNLFTNAFYAVHQKALLLGPAYTPSVRVRTRRVSGGVELHVRDNGTGIPAVVLDKIFDPFFTTKPPGEGTGLGLWLSYDIITNGYDGTLTVRSEEGAFTEFVVTLPQDQGVPVVAAAAGASEEA